MIFSRNRGNAGRHSDNGRGGRHARRRSDEAAEAGGFLDESVDDVDAVEPGLGPYDLSTAPDDGVTRLDLGALRIPAVPGVEVQLQAGPQGDIQHIQLAYGGSRLQLGVFAAPRTEGIWDDVREKLHAALTSSGAKPVEIDGEYGVELRARVHDTTGAMDVRHVGIDGPRWFVHGVYIGAAATDPDRAGPLQEVIHGLVVDRGVEPRPVSEALPLRLPPDAARQLADETAQRSVSQAT